MEKIWLNSYPAGVPEFINENKNRSLSDMIEATCTKFGRRNAFYCMGKALSYQELDQQAKSVASYLRRELRLAKGDRVAVMLPNVLQYPVFVFGVLHAGLVVVNVNPLYTAPELKHQLIDADVKAILVLENFAHVVQAVLPFTKIQKVIVTTMGEVMGFKGVAVDFVVRHIKKLVPKYNIENKVSFSEIVAMGARYKYERLELSHNDLAFLQYTGGTTGLSKGAMLSHGNILANMEQALHWISPVFSGKDYEIVITPLPLYHIFSLLANCLCFFSLGGKNVLIPNPRDIPGFVKELKKHKFTAFTGLNTLFNALLNHPDFAKLDFTKLKLTIGGGMAVQKSVADRWAKVTGSIVCHAYGLTETSPAACINPVTLKEFNCAVGLPISSTLVSIRDDQGQEQPVGASGEVCIKGPQVMQGYWQQPQETALVLQDGWFKTGDIGVMDPQGFVSIVDRKKDMIIVSGFNVFPNEIEDVLSNHPGILENAAVGVKDDRTGEAVKVFIVRKDAQLTKEEIVSFCRKSLTAYKVPKIVEFRESLPKSNVGKILRKELKN